MLILLNIDFTELYSTAVHIWKLGESVAVLGKGKVLGVGWFAAKGGDHSAPTTS